MGLIKWIILITILIYAIAKFVPLFQKITFKNRQNEEQSERIQRMKQDLEHMGMSYKCQSCGSSMTIDPKHISTFCPFCGSALPKAEELVKQSYEYANRDAERKLEYERLRVEEENSKRNNSETLMKAILMGMVIIGWLLIMIKLVLKF